MFSVIIPLYNKAETIARTLSTVLTQTFTAFEVLIVDDGSTDDSVNIIHRFTSDPRIKIIHQKNQGVSVARNTGVKNAQYEYLAFLDGDDEWLPTFLEKVNEAIQQYPEAGMYGTASWHKNYQTGFGSHSVLKQYKEKIQAIDITAYPYALSHTSAVVVSKKAFYQTFPNGDGFPVGIRMREDFICFYQLLFASPFVYIGYPLGIRNNNVKNQITGISSTERKIFIHDMIKYFNMTYSAYLQSNANSQFKMFRKYELRHHIIIYLRNKDYESLNIFLSGIEHLNDLLCKSEINCYNKPSLNKISKLFILSTKLIWYFKGLYTKRILDIK